ncbi:2-dehydro-3-deoxyglucarate aldolase [Phenylobacterium hankyongense]|uniref:2-dehydro-3-deoxyglucarate aldolase n=2 Tax=Phenylobacterium hankyongense TaxID=1813876 RepID=A0A328B503_9CAUL|nr:2-dehydro-3-deoxyglucarate aldolase [Phenylobacterium hankyongense]
MHNAFRARLKAGEPQIGLWQSLASPNTVELCAAAGFDWLLLDGEHGPNSVPLLLAQLQAMNGYASQAVARLPVADATLIKQYLDIGVPSLLVPYVESAEQASAMVRASRYPPEGIRGVAAGLVRASRWGRIDRYVHRANEEVCLLLQVESQAGLENLAAIAATPGVDGVFIGPSDLAASLGYLGEPGHPKVVAAIEGAIKVVLAHGKAAGILALTEAQARHYLDLGCSFVAVGTDAGLLSRAVDELAGAFLAPERPRTRASVGY